MGAPLRTNVAQQYCSRAKIDSGEGQPRLLVSRDPVTLRTFSGGEILLRRIRDVSIVTVVAPRLRMVAQRVFD